MKQNNPIFPLWTFYSLLPNMLATCCETDTVWPYTVVHTHTHTDIYIYIYTGRFIMFSVITNIYNTKTKGPTFMELVTATGKLN
jgi:hypothetical protein